MTIKRYLAKDMSEAMTRIRYELGKDAIIVSSRWIRKKGLKNIFAKKVLEVTAAVEKKEKCTCGSHKDDMSSQQASVQTSKEEQLEKEIRELRKMVSSLIEEKEKANKSGGRKKKFSTIMQQHLKKMDLDAQIIKNFIAFCK